MIDQLLQYFNLCFRFVPTSVFVGMLLLFCIGSILLLAFKGVQKGLRWCAGLLLLEYVFLLFYVAVLLRRVHVNREFDFTPFWSYRAIQEGVVFISTQVIANIVAFIPVGMLLGFVFDRIKWWEVLLIGVGFSVLIETLQFFFKRGFAEFDDVFHNVLGCMIGYGIYVGLKWLRRCVMKKNAIGV